MRDDVGWDGDDDDIVVLQRVLAPLREPPRPWGDVHAQVRFAAAARPPTHAGVRTIAAAVAVAAAVALGWWWGRSDGEPRAMAPAIEPVPVADPPVVEPAPVKTVVVPMPVAVPVASDEAVAMGARREMLFRQFRTLSERRQKHAKGHSTPEEEATTTNVDAAVRASAPDDVARIDNAPQMLNSDDIKAGLAPVKAAARACGRKHKAAPDVTVNIKLSIAGATGLVTSAVAQSPHDRTALGRCVAEALGKAQFPRFLNVSMGVVYPVSM